MDNKDKYEFKPHGPIKIFINGICIGTAKSLSYTPQTFEGKTRNITIRKKPFIPADMKFPILKHKN